MRYPHGLGPHLIDSNSCKVIDMSYLSPGSVIAPLVLLVAGSWRMEMTFVDDLAALRGKVDEVLRVELTQDWYPHPWTGNEAVSIRHSPGIGRHRPIVTPSSSINPA